ncbi:unnamed protein product, partial [Cyprideis torosa]
GAVSWNPSNVVRGPDSDYRVEDPHKKTPPDHYDREIKRHQPQEYQDAVTKFETTLTNPTTAFEQFVNLPRPEPVQWGETQTPRSGLSANTKKKLEVTGLKGEEMNGLKASKLPIKTNHGQLFLFVCIRSSSRLQVRTMATSNTTEKTPTLLLLTEIRDKFQTLKYKLLDDTPCLMELDYTGNIYVHKNGLLSKDDVMKRLTERPNWNRDE